ncbi:MAG: hypothetical protein V2J24_16060 [Pseudomonadales bacterium]|jgi:hypothetical protein|nr:hypothetical protein [Pseudomonadales bacterium]
MTDWGLLDDDPRIRCMAADLRADLAELATAHAAGGLTEHEIAATVLAFGLDVLAELSGTDRAGALRVLAQEVTA